MDTTGKWGYIDNMGNWALPAIYSHAESFSEGLAVVAIEPPYYALTVYFFIDKTGKPVFGEQLFYAAKPFKQGVAAVKLERDSDWGYIKR